MDDRSVNKELILMAERETAKADIYTLPIYEGGEIIGVEIFDRITAEKIDEYKKIENRKRAE